MTKLRLSNWSRFAILSASLMASAMHPPIVAAQAGACNERATDPIVHVPMTSQPFAAIPSADGCWIFVTLSPPSPGTPGRTAVLKRFAGKVTIEREVPIWGTDITGAVLTHDGQLLIVAAANRVVFFGVPRLISGSGDPNLGYLKEGGRPYYNYANVTSDDRYLFVSVETEKAITVVDLAKARASAFAPSSIIGRIPTGLAPIALTFSADERYLFTTSQAAPDALAWPAACRPEGTPAATPPDHALGAVLVIEVARAVSEPARSVVGTVAAGCNPVRLVTSPAGDIAYVSARGSDTVLAFDTGRLRTDPTHALRGSAHVGSAPVGLAVIDGGSKVVVTNSNRFGGGAGDKQFLDVVDVTRMLSGRDAVIGRIPAGAFPREMRVTTDGRTMLVTNFASRTLEIVDLGRLSQAMAP